MLKPEEMEKIARIVSRCPEPRAASIEALAAIQESRGSVSDDCLEALAGTLRMTSAELDSVATFYNFIFRKPVGRLVLTVCDSVSCWMLGADGIREHLTRRLGIVPGQTTADGLFTLLTVPCLGACEQAPAMMIGAELHGNLTPEKIDLLLDQAQEKARRSAK